MRNDEAITCTLLEPGSRWRQPLCLHGWQRWIRVKKNDSQICRRVRNYTLNAFLNETYISSFSGEKAPVEHTGTVNAITKKLNQSIDSLLKSAGSLHGQYWYRALCLSWIVNGFFTYFSRATFTLPVKDLPRVPVLHISRHCGHLMQFPYSLRGRCSVLQMVEW